MWAGLSYRRSRSLWAGVTEAAWGEGCGSLLFSLPLVPAPYLRVTFRSFILLSAVTYWGQIPWFQRGVKLDIMHIPRLRSLLFGPLQNLHWGCPVVNLHAELNCVLLADPLLFYTFLLFFSWVSDRHRDTYFFLKTKIKYLYLQKNSLDW